MKQHQKWSVFCFTFISKEKRRCVSVASTDKEEAKALVLSMYGKVSALREKRLKQPEKF